MLPCLCQICRQQPAYSIKCLLLVPVAPKWPKKCFCRVESFEFCNFIFCDCIFSTVALVRCCYAELLCSAKESIGQIEMLACWQGKMKNSREHRSYYISCRGGQCPYQMSWKSIQQFSQDIPVWVKNGDAPSNSCKGISVLTNSHSYCD